jgi:hypothetical protein
MNLFKNGTKIRSYDFPGTLEYFMDGVIESYDEKRDRYVVLGENGKYFYTPPLGRHVYDDVWIDRIEVLCHA